MYRTCNLLVFFYVTITKIKSVFGKLAIKGFRLFPDLFKASNFSGLYFLFVARKCQIRSSRITAKPAANSVVMSHTNTLWIFLINFHRSIYSLSRSTNYKYWKWKIIILPINVGIHLLYLARDKTPRARAHQTADLLFLFAIRLSFELSTSFLERSLRAVTNNIIESYMFFISIHILYFVLLMFLLKPRALRFFFFINTYHDLNILLPNGF